MELQKLFEITLHDIHFEVLNTFMFCLPFKIPLQWVCDGNRIKEEIIELPMWAMMKRKDACDYFSDHLSLFWKQTETERQKVTCEFEKLYQFLEDKGKSLLSQPREINKAILRNKHGALFTETWSPHVALSFNFRLSLHLERGTCHAY